MAATSQPSQALIDQVKARLIQTGEWDRIANVLRAQLEESGFEDDLKDLAKGGSWDTSSPLLEKHNGAEISSRHRESPESAYAESGGVDGGARAADPYAHVLGREGDGGAADRGGAGEDH